MFAESGKWLGVTDLKGRAPVLLGKRKKKLLMILIIQILCLRCETLEKA